MNEEFLRESNENPEQFILLEQVVWTPLLKDLRTELKDVS